ncbi:hypothetical protein EVAR_25479_1 [Eumeta japonica]|uniref:DUF5641 domain-containing protein n=1 Tax=Eumeta variegata TaxID=151549 RepID=A0A4C1VPG7_EUMVA|nr:hypothetical protein EVAR_25479_1 [Eumeta japonica]
MDELSVKCLLYVDDQVIIAQSAYGLQEMANKMNDSFRKKGMKVNVAVFKAKAAWFGSASGLINSENKYRLWARFDDFSEYRTQFMEAHEALLATLDDCKSEYEAVLTKIDLKTRFEKKYVSDLQVLPTYDQIVSFWRRNFGSSITFHGMCENREVGCARTKRVRPCNLCNRTCRLFFLCFNPPLTKRTKQAAGLLGSTVGRHTRWVGVPLTPVQGAIPLGPARRCTIGAPRRSIFASQNSDLYLGHRHEMRPWCENHLSGRVTQIVQNIWKQLKFEYLHTLQQRYKWRDLAESSEIGDLVLIKQDNVPTLQWQRGRISKLHLRRDNMRVVHLQASTSVLHRVDTSLARLSIH